MSKESLYKLRTRAPRSPAALLQRTLWPLRGGRNWHVILAVLLLAQILATASPAATDPALACDRAARQVSTETGVPLDVLRAITRTETGRGKGSDLRPWPWTVNMEGRGIWFDTEEQARVHVYDRFREGARSFDVGCFQINYKWHGRAFNSIDEMFDPLLNARYAARFLKELHAETGDWTQAAGAFHSRTEKYATRYLSRYTAIRDALPEGGSTGAPATAHLRRNGFPLLQAQGATKGATAYGSLVPLGAGGAGSLFARDG